MWFGWSSPWVGGVAVASGGAVAAGVFGSGVAGAVVGVAEVPCLPGFDGLMAAAAVHLACLNLGCPLCSEFLVGVSVAACGGGSCAWHRAVTSVAFPAMGWYPEGQRSAPRTQWWVLVVLGCGLVLMLAVALVLGLAGKSDVEGASMPTSVEPTPRRTGLPGSSIPPSPGEAYRIGGAWLPGIYEAPGGVGCSWVVQRDLVGDESSVIRRGSTPRVGLREGEYFTSDGCGTWRRVGRI